MNKLRLIAVAAIMGGLAIFAAAPAQAILPPYPDPVVRLTADSPVIGGKIVHFTADTAAHTMVCDWTVTFTDGVAAGENPVRTGTGLSLSGSFKSKPVSKKTPTTMKAECVYDDGTKAPTVAKISTTNTVTPAIYHPGASLVLPAVAVNAVPDFATVILLPVGGEDGTLPDTGGSNISWLYIGGALVLAGGGVTYAARRRHSAR